MVIKDAEIAMVAAAHKALELYKKDPNIETEEVIKIVMKSIDANTNSKIPAVAAVNGVLRLKRQSPSISDKQIIERFVSENRGLIDSVDRD